MTDKTKEEIVNPYEIYETNQDLENGKGVEIEYPFGVFVINRAGGSNKMFSKVFNAKLKPHRRKHEQGILEDEIKLQILIETYAETVVIGWKGVHDRNNKKMPFSVKNCIKLLTDLPDFFTDLQLQAGSYATFKAEQESIEEKN